MEREEYLQLRNGLYSEAEQLINEGKIEEGEVKMKEITDLDNRFDNEAKAGQIASGTALRRMMISPLAKTNRVRMRFDAGIKKAIKLCSQLGGDGIIYLSKEKINIFWNDGLPGDPKEEAEVMAIRTGNKSTLSQYSAIQRLDGLSDEDTAKEIEAIKQDEVNNNPLSNMNFDYGKEDDLDE